jgi:hypothetical protein
MMKDRLLIINPLTTNPYTTKSPFQWHMECVEFAAKCKDLWASYKPRTDTRPLVRPMEAGNCPYCGAEPGNDHSSMCGLHGVPWVKPLT